MGKEELAYIILQALKYDDDNATNEFWDKIIKLSSKVGKLKVAKTINELREMHLIDGTKQCIGEKGDASFAKGLNITLDGINYLKENSKIAKIIKGIEIIKDIMPI